MKPAVRITLTQKISLFITLCGTDDSEPADYEGLDSVPLMFDVSSVVGSRACANVTIEDDDATENDEKFTVELSSCGCDPVFITPNSSKDIVILNNDGEDGVLCSQENRKE